VSQGWSTRVKPKYALGDQLLLLDELHVRQDVCGQLNGLVEPVLAAVRHVANVDDDGLQSEGRGTESGPGVPCLAGLNTATHLPSSRSDWLSSVLKSADPARIMPATLGCVTREASQGESIPHQRRTERTLSLVMKNCTASSATCVECEDGAVSRGSLWEMGEGDTPCARSCAASPCAGARNAAPTDRRGRASWASPP
jgi:hypothetical protein